MPSLYDISVQKSSGETLSMEQYKGKVLLIVNTATQCGLSGQFEELEALWNAYPHDDFMVLGFPSSQFFQEPLTDDVMETACQRDHGVTFPLFAKIEVNGKNTHPLYTYLKKEKGGLLGDEIKWNFTKFLIDREGNVIERYAPTTSPLSLKGDIEKFIG